MIERYIYSTNPPLPVGRREFEPLPTHRPHRRADWTNISDFSGAKHFTMGGEHSAHIFERLKDAPVAS